MDIHLVTGSEFNAQTGFQITFPDVLKVKSWTLVYVNVKCKMLPKYWSSLQSYIQFLILGIHLEVVSEFYAPTACQITFLEVSSDVLKVNTNIRKCEMQNAT